MLVEFSVENFRSIKDEVRLSLVAGGGGELHDTNVITPRMPEGVKPVPLLSSSAIYGPNAGGKSNLIKALTTMRQVVTTSTHDFGELPIVPFKFSEATAEAPSLFEVVVLVDGVRYQYGFTATDKCIYEEWLFAFPKGRTQRWFERALDPDSGKYAYTFGDKLTGDKDVWRRNTRPAALFLSTAVMLNSQQLKPLFNWFSTKLLVPDNGRWSSVHSMLAIQNGGDIKKRKVLDFLKEADFAISDLKVHSEDIPVEDLPREVPQKFRSYRQLKLTTFHRNDTGGLIELELEDESEGTQKMFSYAGPWLDALARGQVLVIDEIHDNLHPLLVKFLVQLFHNSDTNRNQAQLIFSTHETSILNQDVFRRDQIWFCERTKQQSTRLYPLTEFSPRKDVENLERAYLAGRYGALPFVGSSPKVKEPE